MESAKNFRSLKGEQQLSFVASNYVKELPENLIEPHLPGLDGVRLPKEHQRRRPAQEIPGSVRADMAGVQRTGNRTISDPLIRWFCTSQLRLLKQTCLDRLLAIEDVESVSKVSSIPLPAAHALRKLGRDLALARRKRGIATADMASRLFVSRDTLWRLECGDPTVSAGTLATAVFILGLHDRLANLAAPSTDELALSLDEQRLPKRIHRPRP